MWGGRGLGPGTRKDERVGLGEVGASCMPGTRFRSSALSARSCARSKGGSAGSATSFAVSSSETSSSSRSPAECET
jgi:hypothetical protein